MNPSKRKIWWTLTIIAAMALAVLLFLNAKSSSVSNGHFDFGELRQGSMENLVDSTGTLSAMETVEVGSQVSGIIKTLFVDFNSVVHKGEVLAELDRTPFEISVRDAEANVMRAKAKMEQAKAEHLRNQPLFEKGHISETEYLGTRTAFETSKADCLQAEAALSKARINLGYTVIHSPIDGTIIERTINQGQTIAASFQAPKLFVIAQDLKRMEIQASVDESDIGLIREGQNARFTVQSYPDMTFTGTVKQIRLQPTTIQNVVNYTVVIDADNNKGLLLPGMTATVNFVVQNRENVLLIPSSATSYTPDKTIMSRFHFKPRAERSARPNTSREPMGTAYFLDDQGNLQMTRFRKGLSNGREIEVLGHPKMKAGMKVIIGYSVATTSDSAPRGGLFPRPPGGGRRPR